MTHALAAIAANNNREKNKEVERLLLESGWTKVGSFMHDGGPTGNFGICFHKNKKYIFLNFKTVDIYLELLRD
jgi:hypothetical protein